jgi:hypothetical protein
MARTIIYKDMKRGDTPVFQFLFPSPAAGFSWSGITADFSMTAVASPADNSGAAILRLTQALSVDGNNQASFSVQPTTTESNALIPNTKYNIEVQLKDSGGVHVATAVTGTITVDQDYVI